MINLVQESTCQQVFAGFLEPFSVHVLGPDRALMADSLSTTLQLTVTALVYQPLLPRFR